MIKKIVTSLEKIVTSLEVSRKLKDLGIIQESCFYWVNRYHIKQQGTYWSIETHERARELEHWSKEKISAFTVTELGAMFNEVVWREPDREARIITRSKIEQCNQNLKEWREND